MLVIIQQTISEVQMTKDEMKNRISMALEDPVLQQGFEIICNENAERKGEAVKSQKRLTKAKEIIKDFMTVVKSSHIAVCFVAEENRIIYVLKLNKEAEQFLKGEL